MKALGFLAVVALVFAPRRALLAAVDADQQLQLEGAKDRTPSMLPDVLRRLDTRGITTPAKLAAIIDDGAETTPARVLAFERCERRHGKRLYPYTRSRMGVATHFWKTLAEACRAGTPITF